MNPIFDGRKKCAGFVMILRILSGCSLDTFQTRRNPGKSAQMAAQRSPCILIIVARITLPYIISNSQKSHCHWPSIPRYDKACSRLLKRDIPGENETSHSNLKQATFTNNCTIPQTCRLWNGCACACTCTSVCVRAYQYP